MPQIIEENRPKSFIESLLGGASRGGSNTINALPYIDQLKQRELAKEKASQEDLAAEKFGKDFGLNLKGLSPELKKAAIVEGLKGKRKNEEFERTQQYIDKIRGNRSNPQSDESEMQAPYQGFSPSDVSDEDILFAPDRDTQKVLAQMKDVDLREKREAKKFVSDSYKNNKEYINKSYDQYEDALRKDAILGQMSQLGPDTSDSAIINALEQFGLKPEWIQNPSNEAYNKLALDLLGGGTLQADYGSRVLGSEFAVAMQRIPTLSLTKEGREQIAENMRTMLAPSILKKERLQYYLDKAERTGSPLPDNLRGKVLKDIKPELEEIYDKFKQRNGRYKVRSGTIPDDSAIEKYYYLSKGVYESAKKMMEEDGYEVSE